LSCPTADFCVAVETLGNAVVYQSGVWSDPVQIDNTRIHGISCASPEFCVAVNFNGDAVMYDGDEWSQPSHIFQGPLIGVSCPLETFCMAVPAPAMRLPMTEMAGLARCRGYAIPYNAPWGGHRVFTLGVLTTTGQPGFASMQQWVAHSSEKASLNTLSNPENNPSRSFVILRQA